MSTTSATPRLRPDTPAKAPRPLKGMGYGMVVGTSAGALAGMASIVLFVVAAMYFDPATGGNVGNAGALVFGIPFAMLIGGGVGFGPGAVAGLFLGATRLERFTPALAALASGAIGAWLMHSLYAGDGYPDDFLRFTVVVIGVADAVIGFAAGRWFHRLVESPY